MHVELWPFRVFKCSCFTFVCGFCASGVSPHPPPGRRHKRGGLYIPPALWATGGLEVVPGKLPLPLPSPRASDPAPLYLLRANIVFANPDDLPSEWLQKSDYVEPDPLLFHFCWYSRRAFVVCTENDKTQFLVFYNCFNLIAPLKKPRKSFLLLASRGQETDKGPD